MASNRARKRAIELRKMGFTYHEIRRVLAVGYGTVYRWTSHIEPDAGSKGGQPRRFDREEAIRMLQSPSWSRRRIAAELGVHHSAITHMITRMLDSTVEEGGQI